ncbi:methionyl-tRNA formyltransferase [Brucella intermedia]|nr:methionyl-tRNA formyltransferase [Brucella intermedia]PJR94873.1 methionyl-tRNA formyltransferase [Ochrobactrum sp. 721/2009]PJT17298.1 methionyl-tRNA formyltransferase [Ochrobactrum sp. 720/2009]PJT18177.1 methionyl-tRNA formyltransferase [Ochrobactrum sp. 715/2009]PJT30647.1 methionyl-tRNA formyltransferase [Ochrobactrum sp. 695/2009]PJT34938.1 methionyl-tRNA formyltransferase [Ochrobactrum sp. 689/2009]
MRVVFMGTPEFSVPILTAIIGHGYEVVAVYTQPPRPAGRRGLELTKSPVHEKAEQFGIPVFTPKSLRSAEEQDVFASLEADVAIVVAYGLLLPQAILDAPRLGCYNGHASLLPRWRGAAPIQRAIMAGDAETGMMIMKMDAGLDTGPVAMAEKVAITPDMTAGELHDRLSMIGADLMIRALGALERESLALQPQAEEGVTYAAKIDKAEARIDWSKPAKDVHNTIRGLSPFPGAWCEMEINGVVERVKLQRSTLGEGRGEPGVVLDDRLTVACGEGAVRLVTLQRSGGKPLPAQEFLRGAQVTKVL